MSNMQNIFAQAQTKAKQKDAKLASVLQNPQATNSMDNLFSSALAKAQSLDNKKTIPTINIDQRDASVRNHYAQVTQTPQKLFSALNPTLTPSLKPTGYDPSIAPIATQDYNNSPITRIGREASAVAKDIAGNNLTALSMIGKLGELSRTQSQAKTQIQMELNTYEKQLQNPNLSTTARANLEKYIKADQEELNNIPQEYSEPTNERITAPFKWLDEKAASLKASSQSDATKAEQGTSGIGKALLQVEKGGLQLGGNLVAGAVTGTGVLPMAVNAFGGAAYDAQQNGGSFGKQLAYGGLQGATVALTGGLMSVGESAISKVIGSGPVKQAVADATNKAISKFIASDTGRAVASRLAATGETALSQGTIGAIQTTLTPVYQRLTYDPTAKLHASDLIHTALESAIIGSVFGAAGKKTVPEGKANAEAELKPKQESAKTPVSLRPRFGESDNTLTSGLNNSGDRVNSIDDIQQQFNNFRQKQKVKQLKEVYNERAEQNSIDQNKTGDYNEGAGNVGTTRVGRWMSQAEYKKLLETGTVPESFSGTTHVANPADISAFGKQAKPGSVYVEFDVPSTSIKPTSNGWSKIIGPNSLEGRLALKKGLALPEMPKATNIKIVGGK